jgi:hypothetical protein
MKFIYCPPSNNSATVMKIELGEETLVFQMNMHSNLEYLKCLSLVNSIVNFLSEKDQKSLFNSYESGLVYRSLHSHTLVDFARTATLHKIQTTLLYLKFDDLLEDLICTYPSRYAKEDVFTFFTSIIINHFNAISS